MQRVLAQSNNVEYEIYFFANVFSDSNAYFSAADSTQNYLIHRDYWSRRGKDFNFVDVQRRREIFLRWFANLVPTREQFLLYWNDNFLSESTHVKKSESSKFFLSQSGVPYAALITTKSVLARYAEWWAMNHLSYSFVAGWNLLSQMTFDPPKEENTELNVAHCSTILQKDDSSIHSFLRILGNVTIIIFHAPSRDAYVNYATETLGGNQRIRVFPTNLSMHAILQKSFMDEFVLDDSKLNFDSMFTLDRHRSRKSLHYLQFWMKFLFREAIRYFHSEEARKNQRVTYLFQGTLLSSEFMNRVSENVCEISTQRKVENLLSSNSSSALTSSTSSYSSLLKKNKGESRFFMKEALYENLTITSGKLFEEKIACFVCSSDSEIRKFLAFLEGRMDISSCGESSSSNTRSSNHDSRSACVTIFSEEAEFPLATFLPESFGYHGDFDTWNRILFWRKSMVVDESFDYSLANKKLFPKKSFPKEEELLRPPPTTGSVNTLASGAAARETNSREMTRRKQNTSQFVDLLQTFRYVSVSQSDENLPRFSSFQKMKVKKQEYYFLETVNDAIIEFERSYKQFQYVQNPHQPLLKGSTAFEHFLKFLKKMLLSAIFPVRLRLLLLQVSITAFLGGTVMCSEDHWISHIDWRSLVSQRSEHQESAVLFFSNVSARESHPVPFLKTLFVAQPFCKLFVFIVQDLCDYLLRREEEILITFENDEECEEYEEAKMLTDEEETEEFCFKLDCLLHIHHNKETLLLPSWLWSDTCLFASADRYQGGVFLGRYPRGVPRYILPRASGITDIKKLTILMLVRNNAEYLDTFLFPMLRKIESFWYETEFKYAILENGSIDSTREVLLNAKSEKGDRMFLLADEDEQGRREQQHPEEEHDVFTQKKQQPRFASLDQLERSHRIGILRNVLVNESEANGFLEHYSFSSGEKEEEEEEGEEMARPCTSWVLLLDSDILFSNRTLHSLVTDALQNDDFSAVCANIKEPKSEVFYDTLSYDYGSFFFDRDVFCEKMVSQQKQSTAIHETSTCFGGMMLLRQPLLSVCRWGQHPSTLISSNSRTSCEHYHFCRMLAVYGKIGISWRAEGYYIETWNKGNHRPLVDKMLDSQ